MFPFPQYRHCDFGWGGGSLKALENGKKENFLKKTKKRFSIFYDFAKLRYLD